MSPFKQEELNEDLKERIEELTVSVNLDFKKINHDFLQQNQKNCEYLVMYEVSAFTYIFVKITKLIATIFNFSSQKSS